MNSKLEEKLDLDERHYRALKKLHSSWHYVRWLQLFSGGIIFAFGIFFLFQGHKRASSTDVWDEEAVLFYPMGWTFFVMGIAMCVFTLAKWRGDPVIALLLKLLHQTDTMGKGKEGDKTAGV